MRILITAPGLEPGQNVSGISSVVSSIIESVKEAEFSHLRAGRTDRDVFGFLSYVSLVYNLLTFISRVKKNKIQLFHQNIPLNAKGVLREYLYNRFAKWCGIPILIHIHGGCYLDRVPRLSIINKMIQAIFDSGFQTLVLNQYEKDQLVKLYGKQSEILRNAVDTKQYYMKESLFDTNKPVFLFLGRIHDSKGLDEVVEAFSLIYPRMPFKFILCGAGTQEETYTGKFRKILGEDFDFRGVVTGDDKIAAIQESGYFILPSYSEGLPIALLETMSCGVIPIVSDDTSLTMVVHHMKNGVVARKASGSDLAKRITELLILSNEEKIKISMEARKCVVENYDVEAYNRSLIEIYKSILKN